MYSWISRTFLFTVTAAVTAVAYFQSEVQTRTVVVNDHKGQAIVYRIDGQTFISLQALAEIASGSMAERGNEIVLTIPGQPAAQDTPAAQLHLSQQFVRAAMQNLSSMSEWYGSFARAVQQGVPGDGSRLTAYRDRAAHELSLATVAADTNPDRNALQLLQSHFNHVDAWTTKLIDERKRMNTGRYSLSPDALERDPQYQQIATCSKFLRGMLASELFHDNPSCH